MNYNEDDLSFYDHLYYPNCYDQKMGYNPYLNGMNMTKMDSYQRTMEFPVYALNEYNDSDEDDRDWEYMKRMYPRAAKIIQKEVEEECDKLEYEGSCMFDEYPDRTCVTIIINRIHERLKDMDDSYNELEAENFVVSEQQFDEFERRDGRRPFFPSRRPFGRDHFGNLIEVLLLNEFIKRRRRHRRRRHDRDRDRHRDDRRRY